MKSNQPIAILDSGVGGLNVLKALKKIAPKEKIFYYGDTAHFPYGTKNPELITQLALDAAKKIVARSNAKLLIIACHTISVTCLEKLAEELNIKVIGINHSSVSILTDYIYSQKEKIREVLLLSTKATLDSGYYKKAWQGLNIDPEITLNELSLGSLVKLVEEGYSTFADTLGLADKALPKNIRNADLVLLCCTHFLPLEPVFKKVFKPGCEILDAAMHCAQFAVSWLKQNNLLSNNNYQMSPQIFVSGNPQSFFQSAIKVIDCPKEIYLLD